MKKKTGHLGLLPIALAFSTVHGLLMLKASADIVVDLDATTLAPGPLQSWANIGTIGGTFESAGLALPEVTAVGGVKSVRFLPATDPNTTSYSGPIPPTELTVNGARTFEAWIYDDFGEQEKTVFSWGGRVNLRNSTFGHGGDTVYGAASYGSGTAGKGQANTDIGYYGKLVTNGRWTHVAIVYDPVARASRSYVDGYQVGEKVTYPLNTLANSPFRIGRQSDASGNVIGAVSGGASNGVGAFSLAKVRIHNTSLTRAQIRSDALADGAKFWPDTDFAPGGTPDGIPDWFEAQYDFDVVPTVDTDGDGLNNLAEYQLGTNLQVDDTDGDGVKDGDESNRLVAGILTPTDPFNPDTDGDGLGDSVEINRTAGNPPVPAPTNPLSADTDGDTYTDELEILSGSDPLVATSIPSAERGPLVNLDATKLPVGAASLSSWTNTGSLGGEFKPTNPGTVETLDNITGVKISGSGGTYYGPVSPASICGNSSVSAEAWIYNPALASEEPIVSWGRRGGPTGTNAAFNHGTNANYGAVGHYDDPADIGWAGKANSGVWTHVAYTYDGNSRYLAVYRDGELANSKTVQAPLNVWLTAPDLSRLKILVGGSVATNGLTIEKAASLTIAKIRIYDRTLSAQAIQASFAADKDTFFPSAAPNITSLTINGNSGGSPTVTIVWTPVTVAAGREIVLETSTDLGRWVATTEVLTGGTHTFTPTDPLNPGTAMDSKRFYRIRLQDAPPAP